MLRLANKEVSKNYYNIPSKLSNDELLVYYRLCENANFTLEEFRDKKKGLNVLEVKEH